MNQVKIIKSEIFKKFQEVKFGISTKSCPGSKPPFHFNLSYRVGDEIERVRRNRKIFFDTLGIKETDVTFQKQTHSTKSNYVTTPSFFQDSDALYTDVRSNYLAVSIADCIPVFLYEPRKKVAAAIHSGWKGTVNNITSSVVEKLSDEFSLDKKNIHAYIGPGISVDNFEVGQEVAVLFGENVKVFRSGKYYVDLKKHNYLQLIKCGLVKNNIEVSEYCTYNEKELFHSYRRDRDNSGRMLGVIGIV